MAPLHVDMAGIGPGPDGMGMDTYRERENMKAARNAPEPTHDVVARDMAGETLYVTESTFSEQEAIDVAAELNSGLGEGGDTSVPQEVARFAVEERD